MMTTGFISIGSNIDKEIHIPKSLIAIKLQFGAIVVSSLYESEAMGFEGADFHNLIVQFKSNLTAEEVAKQLKVMELNQGRTRNCKKYSARTLDLDLILFGEQIINEGSLQIPRDEIIKYAFVLEPLAEIAPNLLHPISKISYIKLWHDYDKTNLKQEIIPSSFID